jgi:hypothetical protein
VLFFCTAHNLDARPAIYAVANGGLVEEKKRRIHLLAYSFNNIDCYYYYYCYCYYYDYYYGDDDDDDDASPLGAKASPPH